MGNERGWKGGGGKYGKFYGIYLVTSGLSMAASGSLAPEDEGTAAKAGPREPEAAVVLSSAEKRPLEEGEVNWREGVLKCCWCCGL